MRAERTKRVGFTIETGLAAKSPATAGWEGCLCMVDWFLLVQGSLAGVTLGGNRVLKLRCRALPCEAS